MPLRYLLDTNIISDLVRRRGGTVATRIADVGEDTICTSVIVAAELRCGAAKSDSKQLSERVGLLLSALDILPLEPRQINAMQKFVTTSRGKAHTSARTIC